MRHREDRDRRAVLFARLRIGLVGALLAGTLVALAAGHLHGGTLERPEDSPALAYAEQQAARAKLVTPRPTTSVRASVTATPVRNTFPVGGRATYGRTHHDYPAADMFARCGSAFLAPVDGTIEHLNGVDRWRAATNAGADRGGLSVAVLGRDGVRYYGSHLRALQPGLKLGAAVRAGAKLGEVGQTGSAEGTGCHLHFGISPACAGLRGADWWNRRGAIPPAPYLDAWRKGQSRSPVGEAAAWQRAHGCPAAASAYP